VTNEHVTEPKAIDDDVDGVAPPLQTVCVDDDVEAFRVRVVAARRTQSDELILNSSERHACVLIEELFHAAQSHVRIFCKTLNPGVYATPAVIAAARAFVRDRNGRIDVWVQDESALARSNAFIDHLSGLDRVSIRPARGRWAHDRHNFMLVDDLALRFEEDRDQHDARASFNWPQMGAILARFFDLIAAESSPAAAG